jgi:hypothetical protein
MPFNRVNNAKAISYWLLILKEWNSEENAKNEKDEKKSPPLQSPVGTWYIPGLMLIPIPQAGILGYIDVAYWAVFLYVLGSIAYVIDSFFLWPRVYAEYSDDPANPAVYVNLLAALLFVINALVCHLDWYLQRQQLSAMNIIADDNITGGFELTSISYTITWYYFFNNFFFLGAAVVYMIQGIWAENYSWDLFGCSNGL